MMSDMNERLKSSVTLMSGLFRMFYKAQFTRIELNSLPPALRDKFVTVRFRGEDKGAFLNFKIAFSFRGFAPDSLTRLHPQEA